MSVRIASPHGYLRRQKNDAADAEAICEAVRSPTIRFVAVKSVEQQGVLVLHRSRELLVRHRTMFIIAIRAHCAEFGVIAAQGATSVRDLIERIGQADGPVLAEMARSVVMLMAEQLHAFVMQIQVLERFPLILVHIRTN